jgi:hypothetical protein
MSRKLHPLFEGQRLPDRFAHGGHIRNASCAQDNVSSSADASIRSGVAKPSV